MDSTRILKKHSTKKAIVEARKMIKKAYAPYSKFSVGCALVSKVGSTVIGGCNVENGVNGASVCAERVAIGKAVSYGYKNFELLVVATPTKIATPPCGICLQTLSEFCDSDLPVLLINTQKILALYALGDLYPHMFRLKRYSKKS